jgi:O-antigen/teichoic acid export membrane protein
VRLALNHRASGSLESEYTPRNRIREFNCSVYGGAAVSLLSNLSLIPFIGIWGAVIVRVLYEMFVMGVRIRTMLKGSEFKFESKNTTIFD